MPPPPPKNARFLEELATRQKGPKNAGFWGLFRAPFFGVYFRAYQQALFNPASMSILISYTPTPSEGFPRYLPDEEQALAFDALDLLFFSLSDASVRLMAKLTDISNNSGD